MDDGVEPIGNDELLFRRVPASMSWYDPSTGELDAQAFGPNKKYDATGISVDRARFKTIEDAARGWPDRSYFVAVLKVSDLREADIAIESRPKVPDGYDPAHAEMPDLNAGNRKDDITLERQRTLAHLCLRVEGPFDTPPE